VDNFITQIYPTLESFTRRNIQVYGNTQLYYAPHYMRGLAHSFAVNGGLYLLKLDWINNENDFLLVSIWNFFGMDGGHSKKLSIFNFGPLAMDSTGVASLGYVLPILSDVFSFSSRISLNLKGPLSSSSLISFEIAFYISKAEEIWNNSSSSVSFGALNALRLGVIEYYLVSSVVLNFFLL